MAATEETIRMREKVVEHGFAGNVIMGFRLEAERSDELPQTVVQFRDREAQLRTFAKVSFFLSFFLDFNRVEMVRSSEFSGRT